MKHNISYKVVRRNIKYPRIEIKTGDLVVVAPRDATFDIDNFVSRHARWIEQKFEFIKKIKSKFRELRVDEKTPEELKSFVLEKVEDFGKEIEADPNKIRFIEMKTKWGSCSSAGNLTFNKLLRFLPKEVIEYVVYHEMCHLRHLKHNKGFWSLIEKKYSDHKKYEEKLFGYWFLISRN
jgi:hypothetical protein